MSETDVSVVAMLQGRLQMVQDLSRINARRLLNQQIVGGAEFAIMRMQSAAAEGSASQAEAAALQEELDRRDKAKAAMAADDAVLAALEGQLEDLDKRIAAADRK